MSWRDFTGSDPEFNQKLFDTNSQTDWTPDTGTATFEINGGVLTDILDKQIREISHQQARRIESDIMGASLQGRLISWALSEPPKYNLNRKVLIL